MLGFSSGLGFKLKVYPGLWDFDGALPISKAFLQAVYSAFDKRSVRVRVV